MRPLFVLITLMSGFPLVAASQHSFSDSSRLKDPIYVRQQIREISHADLWSALDTDIPALTGARRAAAAGDYRQAIRCWADYWASHARPGYVTTLDRLLLDTDLLADVDSFRAAMNHSTDDATCAARTNDSHAIVEDHAGQPQRRDPDTIAHSQSETFCRKCALLFLYRDCLRTAACGVAVWESAYTGHGGIH